jgi:hypothetical protein
MKQSRFGEEQIIGVLREHEAGAVVAKLAASMACRRRRSMQERRRMGDEVSEAKL